MSGPELVDTDEEAWDLAAEAPVRELLARLQAEYPGLKAEGGTFVVELPPGDTVAEATGREAVRLLAVSLRRRWAAHGITVEIVGR
jgi:hypothetical protein